MNKKIVIITGANRGLGKSMAHLFMKEPLTTVISISRSLSLDQEQYDRPSNFIFIKQDLVQLSVNDLKEFGKFIKTTDKIVFISNAGIIQPISDVGGFSVADFEMALNTNVKPSVIIANYILQHFKTNKIDFVNISSGAAGRPIANWSLYCSAKAFNKMFFDTIGLENRKNKKIRVFNLDPGVMDTNMQENIRNQAFPDRKEFLDLKEQGRLKTADEAAMHIISTIR